MNLIKLNKINFIYLIISFLFLIFFITDIFIFEFSIVNNLIPTSYDLRFIDLRGTIQSVKELSEIYSSGQEKISSTEPFGRVMNYPDIWVYIFNLIKYIGDPVFIFGFFSLILYMFFAIYILSKNHSKNNIINFIHILIIFSPPIILLLERGSNETFVFLILFLSIISKNFLSGFLLGLATSLKLYPLALFPFYILQEKINKSFILGFFLSLPIVIWSFKVFLNVFSVTSSGFGASFGIKSISLFFIKFFDEIFNLLISEDLIIVLYILSVLTFLILSLILIRFYDNDLKAILNIFNKSTQELNIFFLLSIQILILFLIFSNYAYRMILLIYPTILLFNVILRIENFSLIKKYIYITICTSPYLALWLPISWSETSKNHHIWVLYSVITFLSFVLYFSIISIALKDKFLTLNVKIIKNFKKTK